MNENNQSPKGALSRSLILFGVGFLCALILVFAISAISKNGKDKEIAAIETETETIEESTETITETETVAETTTAVETETVIETETVTETAETEQGEQIVKDVVPDDAIQVVAFGDSIWDKHRDPSGINGQLSMHCNAYVYNCAFGATTAALLEDDSEHTDDRTLTVLSDIATGQAGNIIPDEYDVRDIINKLTFSRTNYFVLAYGLNDFFEGVPINNSYFNLDKTCYTGALRYAVQNLKKAYPDCQIIIVSPTYYANASNNNYGSLDDYIKAAAGIASECGTMYYNPNTAIGITPANAASFTEDGVHLNEAARAKYAETLGDLILNDWNNK